MEDTIIKRITDVKYTGFKSPTASPFCDTIRATSPLVIIPTPILIACFGEYRSNIAIREQPIILEKSATATNASENQRIFQFISLMSVFKPMDAKKIGPNII